MTLIRWLKLSLLIVLLQWIYGILQTITFPSILNSKQSNQVMLTRWPLTCSRSGSFRLQYFIKSIKRKRTFCVMSSKWGTKCSQQPWLLQIYKTIPWTITFDWQDWSLLSIKRKIVHICVCTSLIWYNFFDEYRFTYLSYDITVFYQKAFLSSKQDLHLSFSPI